MKNNLKTIFIATMTGIVMGLGLGWSGMTEPANILAFLNWRGAWQADLLFVMLGALTTSSLGFAWSHRRQLRPWFAEKFEANVYPKNQKFDRGLLFGAILFGAGWGLSGYCPGPAWLMATHGRQDAIIFIFVMLLSARLGLFLKKLQFFK